MKIHYREFKPSLALQPYVDNYWFQVFDGASNEVSPVQRCLPLGMAQIIIHVNRHECMAFFDNQWKRLPDAFFVGIYKDAVTWKTSGYSVCFGISLKPESLMKLFKIPASTVFNAYTDINNFVSKKVASLSEKMFDIECPVTLTKLAEEFLITQLRNMKEDRNFVDEATRMIRHSKGNISIEELSKNLYISERKLQRGFKDLLGTGPKTYTRIIRFRNAFEHVQLAREKEEISWADISYHYGYADQAHMIRDFKEFTGTKPTNVIQNNAGFYQLTNELVY